MASRISHRTLHHVALTLALATTGLASVGCGDAATVTAELPQLGCEGESCGIQVQPTGCTSDAECAAGSSCSAAGSCVDVAPTLTGALDDTTARPVIDCEPTVTSNVTEVEVAQSPTVMFVIDNSRSMGTAVDLTDDDGNVERSTRFDVVQAAVLDLVEAKQGGVAFGMAHYSSSRTAASDAFGACVAWGEDLASTPFALDNYDALAAQVSRLVAGSGTPTGESLEQAISAFDQVESDGPKHIVLATDGLPDTCAEPNAESGDEDDPAYVQAQQYVIDAAERARELGITVHVIGLGEEVNSTDHLSRVAEAGGGQAAAATNGNEIQRAFADIVETVTAVEEPSCSFSLGFDGDAEASMSAFATAGTITLDAQRLVQGTDWRLEGDEAILIGEACESYKTAGGTVEISAVQECNTQIPIR